MGTIKKRLLAVCLVIICSLGQIAPYAAKTADVKKGNTIGNLDQGGFVVREGDWLYMKDKYTDDIRKVKIDGSKSKVLSVPGDCSPDYYNIVDGWIYYTKVNMETQKSYICKQRTSGGKEIKLCSEYAFGSPSGNGALYVYDNWIYYILFKGWDGYIYRMKTDGTKKTAIVKIPNALMSFCIDGKWLYYIDLEQGLYKVKLDGTSKMCLKKGINFQKCNVDGDWVYYLADDHVYKMKKDGSNHKKFLSNADDFNINNGWVYYDNEKGLHKVKTDGSLRKTIVKAGTLLGVSINSIYLYNIVDDTIYFKYKEYKGMKYPSYKARVNADGTDLKPNWLPVENIYDMLIPQY